MIPLANNFQTPYTRIQNLQRLHATQDATQAPTKSKCYNCEEREHIATRCPNLHSRPPLTPTSNLTPPPNRNGNANPVQAREICSRMSQSIGYGRGSECPNEWYIPHQHGSGPNHSLISFLFSL
jgi:hypothetical protein